MPFAIIKPLQWKSTIPHRNMAALWSNLQPHTGHHAEKGRGLDAPWRSYPVLPPSAAGSSPPHPAHPAASVLHPQHRVSQNSCLEMSRVDPPVPGKQKKDKTESLKRKILHQLHSLWPSLLSHTRHSTTRSPVLTNATDQEEGPGLQDLMVTNCPTLVPQHYMCTDLTTHIPEGRDTWRPEINQNQRHSSLFWSPKLCNLALKLGF